MNKSINYIQKAIKVFIACSAITISVSTVLAAENNPVETNRNSQKNPSMPGNSDRITKKAKQISYFETWVENIGSTDPGGLGYHPFKNCLILTDSEINEYSFYGRGNNENNIFFISLDGKKTIGKYSVGKADARGRIVAEPTGIIYNENDHHYYISNDDAETITRYDSLFNPTGLVVNLKTFNCLDAEGIAYDLVNNEYYISSGDGGSREIFVLNGNFKLSRKFSVMKWVNDPEGVSFDPVSRHLFVVAGGKDNLIVEFTPEGQYIAEYSIKDLVPKPIHIDAITIVPDSDKSIVHVFLGDRGIDNNTVPPGSYSEDGRIYEVFLKR